METLNKLRHRQRVTVFDHKEKLFTAIQINKKESFICFQRLVSKDKRNWTEWKKNLSLKDCKRILDTIKTNNTLWKTGLSF